MIRSITMAATQSAEFSIMIFTIVAIIAVIIAPVETNPCPHGWVHHASSCYLFISDVHKDWRGAMSHCNVLQAKLVEIETAAEDEFIRLHLKNNNYTGQFWMGLSDILREGEWVWMSSQKVATYTNWGPGLPDNYANNEDCGTLWNHYGFLWNDKYCGHHVNFICENEMLEGMLVG
ncbi:perlucin-like protein [Saccostrea cucullata]|uniref:perlucin-like protein n=1 Tax=Saccostrea cuccullata TaxID=36930 RepID=UPI002ED11340